MYDNIKNTEHDTIDSDTISHPFTVAITSPKDIGSVKFNGSIFTK